VAYVGWTNNALDDLEAICQYIARSSPAAAAHLALSVFEAVEQLQSFPRMGRGVPDVMPDHVRELVLENYLIGYRVVSEDAVEILAIHHGARHRGPGET
jgi:plasmid stabilization system protein ParE